MRLLPIADALTGVITRARVDLDGSNVNSKIFHFPQNRRTPELPSTECSVTSCPELDLQGNRSWRAEPTDKRGISLPSGSSLQLNFPSQILATPF